MQSSTLAEKSETNKTIKRIAWSLTIVLSWIPDIFFHELTGNVPNWLGWMKVGLVLTFIALSFLWKEIRVLRNYALVFGALWLSLKLHSWAYLTSWFQNLLNNATTLSARELLKELPELIFPGIMILTLLMLHRNWRLFFFAKGDTSVHTEPVLLLGVRAGTSVRTFGTRYTFIISVVVALWLGLSLRPSPSMVIAALPLLPIILLTALLSTFGEEVLFRASLLSVSHEAVGKGQSLWMAAFVFGSAHYIGGQPSLLLGFVITAILGWGLGKIMLESRSILLPWLLHFAINSIVFFFNEMGISLQRF